MALFKKKEEDIDEIKRIVSPPLKMPVQLPKNIPEIDRLESEPSRTPPLFIKIERYKEVLENVSRLRAMIHEIDNIVSLRREIEKVRTNSDSLLEKNIQEFSEILSGLDKEFVRPEHMEHFLKETKVERLDSYVAELEEELNRLKNQMRQIK